MQKIKVVKGCGTSQFLVQFQQLQALERLTLIVKHL